MKKVKSLIIFVGVAATFASAMGEKMASERFLELVRKPKMASTWAKLKGYAQHKRDKIVKDDKVVQKKVRAEAEIELGILFKSASVMGKVLFDKNELYFFSQVFGSGVEGAISKKEGCRKGDSSKMRELFGISESDLSLSFLYWDFVKEHPSEKVTFQTCRVLELENSQTKERVRVWINREWLAPMKAQWYKAGADKPYRTAEFTGTKKVAGDLYIVKSFTISDGSWETRVEFEEFEAAKKDDKSVPKDLFPKL